MADPLSITLAVVSLTTALKDIIELAQTLYDSFKKPARNMKKVESLAAETLEIVQDLKRLYDGHKEILDSAPDMQHAVLRLLKDMETVHEKCKPMLQLYTASDGNLHTWIKQKVGPWWKRNSIEESIRNLRDGANKCRSNFMTFALLRIEAATAEVQATTIEIRTAVTHRFARPHIQVFDDNFLAFLGSTPVILSQLPPHVQLAEHLVYKEYITFQVGKIDTLFKTLSSRGSYPVEEPDTVHLKLLRLVNFLKPVTKEQLEDVQSNIFSLIAKIQDSIQGRDNDGLSTQRGAWAMSRLSTRLRTLNMYQESLTIAQSTVDLYRTLGKTNSDVYGPYLAHALYSLSRSRVDTRDHVQAYKAITEAVTIGRRLVAANPTFEAQIQLAYLVYYSSYVARLNGDLKNASRDAEEVVQSHERLIGQATSVLQMEVNIIDKMRGPTTMTLEGTQINHFAQALAELHYSLSSTSRKNESVSAGIKALELYSALDQRAGHNCTRFSLSIAELYHSLASDEYRNLMSIDQSLSYAQQSVSQYEKVLRLTGNVPGNLPLSLARHAKILSDLDRIEEACVVCQNFEQIVQKHIEDHQLRAKSLLHLTQSLYYSKRYVEAMSVGEQLLATYRSSLLGWDLYSVYWYTSRAFKHQGNTFKAVQFAESAVSYWRMLTFKQYPEQQIFLIRCILDHADLLEDCDHLAEARAAIEEALSWFDSHPAQDADSAELYTDTLLFSARLFCDQGHPDEALSAHDKVIKVGEPFADVRSVVSNTLWAKVETLRELCFIGRVPAALAEVEDCLTYAAEHDLEKEEIYRHCLFAASFVCRCSGDIDKAIFNIRRAIDILEDRDRSLYSSDLSDLLADAGEDEEALIAAHEAMQRYERLQKPSLTIDKEYYADAQHSLSLRFFASNDFSRGRELLLEVRSFCRQQAQTKNLWFIHLGITLWALGNLECASGRHEEGIAARTELTEMRKRLRHIFPSLDDLVDIGLKREQNFAAWKNLLKKINLTCGHQELFEESATPQIEHTLVSTDPILLVK